jgi:hypothetical protein
MIRDLRAFGLALVTVLVMSGTVASAAWGVTDDAQVTVDSFLATLDGTQAQPPVMTREGRTTTCKNVEFHGELANSNSNRTTVTGTPTFSNCHTTIPLLGTLPITITMNGCAFLFHLVENTSQMAYIANAEMTCSPGKQWETHVYSSHSNHTNNTSLCTAKIPGQTSLGDRLRSQTNLQAKIGRKTTSKPTLRFRDHNEL